MNHITQIRILLFKLVVGLMISGAVYGQNVDLHDSLSITVGKNTYWWAGVINHGNKMPLRAPPIRDDPVADKLDVVAVCFSVDFDMAEAVGLNLHERKERLKVKGLGFRARCPVRHKWFVTVHR